MNTPGTYSPDTPVPASQRVFGGRDLFSLWFSLGIGLMVLQTGALLAPGLGMSGGDFSGHTGGRFAARQACGVVGGDTGLSSMAALKLSLGSKGASLPAVLNLLQLIGWGSFEIIVDDAMPPACWARGPLQAKVCGPVRCSGHCFSAHLQPCWQSADP